MNNANLSKMGSIIPHVDGDEFSDDDLKNLSSFEKVKSSTFKESLERTWRRMGKGKFQEPDIILALKELEQLYTCCVEVSPDIYSAAEINDIQNKTTRKTDSNGHFTFCAKYNFDRPDHSRSILKLPICLCSMSQNFNGEIEHSSLKAQISKAEWILHSAFREQGNNDKILGVGFTKTNVLEACSEQQFLDLLRNYARYTADVGDDMLHAELTEYEAQHGELFTAILNTYRQEQQETTSGMRKVAGSESGKTFGPTLTSVLRQCRLEKYIKYRAGTVTLPRLSTRRSALNLHGEWEDINVDNEYGSTEMLDKGDFQSLADLWYVDYERLKHTTISPQLRNMTLSSMVKYRHKWFAKFELVSDQNGKLQPQYKLSRMGQGRAELDSDEVEEEWILLDD